jgi:hypothetical protein
MQMRPVEGIAAEGAAIVLKPGGFTHADGTGTSVERDMVNRHHLAAANELSLGSGTT